MRVYQKHPWDNEMLQPTSGAMLDFLPPVVGGLHSCRNQLAYNSACNRLVSNS
jgi:hypothetical protein